MATVLVCDDDPALRELVRAALADGDYDIAEARSGSESVRVAKEIRPDVVVLDMVLPDRSGLDVLAELRSDPTFDGTRVILCTAHTIALAGDGGDGLGADAYLPKPFSPKALAETVAKLVGARP